MFGLFSLPGNMDSWVSLDWQPESLHCPLLQMVILPFCVNTLGSGMDSHAGLDPENTESHPSGA